MCTQWTRLITNKCIFIPCLHFLELFRPFCTLETCPDYVGGKYFLTLQNNIPLKQNGRHLVLFQGERIYIVPKIYTPPYCSIQYLRGREQNSWKYLPLDKILSSLNSGDLPNGQVFLSRASIHTTKVRISDNRGHVFPSNNHLIMFFG